MQNILHTTYVDIPINKYKRAVQKRKTKLNKLILFQRLLGLILIALSIATTKILLDMTIAIILIPVGIFLLITKEQILEL